MSIPSWTRDYVSLPYEEVDCWGLVKRVYKEIYDVELAGVRDQRDLIKDGFWEEVIDGWQAGDVMLFKTSAVVRHVAIYIDDEYMLHSDRGCGSVIERWGARNWLPRLRSVYRCKQIS